MTNNRSFRLNSNYRKKIKSLDGLKDFDKAFDRSFSIVAYAANRFLIDHFLRAARLLDVKDYETLIVWGVLTHQNILHLMPPGSVPDAVLTDNGRLLAGDAGLKPIRLRDLSEITGFPRETVRRKLGILHKARFVRRVGSGWVASSERAESDLRDFTKDTIMRLLAVCDEIVMTLESADADAGDGQ
jgi:hypothetical protein